MSILGNPGQEVRDGFYRQIGAGIAIGFGGAALLLFSHAANYLPSKNEPWEAAKPFNNHVELIVPKAPAISQAAPELAPAPSGGTYWDTFTPSRPTKNKRSGYTGGDWSGGGGPGDSSTCSSRRGYSDWCWHPNDRS